MRAAPPRVHRGRRLWGSKTAKCVLTAFSRPGQRPGRRPHAAVPPQGSSERPHGQALRLDLPERAKVRSAADVAEGGTLPALVTITLNGEPYQLDGPVSVSTLLATLAIDSRRVAVEHNLVVVRRALFDSTIVRE